MNEAKTITMREWEKRSYSGLGDDAISHLEVANKKLGGGIFDFFRHEFRAKSYVGVVAAGGTTVEVLPKIQGSDPESLAYLLALLLYTGDFGSKVGDAADLGEHRGSFLEAWISYFADELNRLICRNYKQRYVEIEERSTFVRGKLLTERDMDGRSKLDARYPCRYEIFTPDHLLNRTLKFCNKLLLKQTRSQKNRGTLRENDFLLEEVSDEPVLARDLDRIHLNRLDREYEGMLDLCRLLLENSTLNLRSGRITQLALVFDMNILFEKFVAAFLRRNKERIFIGGSPVEDVETQESLGKLFGEFGMKVDVILRAGDLTYLLDTKYKVLDEEKTHDNLSQSDFYQMFGYLRAGDERYDDIILLYPRTEVSPKNAEFENGDGAKLFVRTVDVAECHDGRGNVRTAALIGELNRAFEGIEVREGALA